MTIYSREDFLAIARRSHKSVAWRAAVITSMNRANRRLLIKVWQRNRRKPKNRHRNRGFAVEEMEHLTDRQFKEMFRIDRAAFDWLSEELDPLLRRNEVKAKNSSGSAISTGLFDLNGTTGTDRFVLASYVYSK